MSGLQGRIKRDLDNANWLKEQIETNPEWEIVASSIFQTLCIRHIPKPNMDEQAIATHNLKLGVKNQ
ncbi:MAG: hypothetical protein IPK14_27900 [Blastocatellia bacterium]|nr:hypothetical protein [Blastocatellia bacterium]